MAKKKSPYPERFKKLFREMIPKYRENLGVGAYAIDTHYMDGNDPCKPRCAMEIRVDTDYLRASITVYPNALDDWKRKGDEEFREEIAHEMAHLATQPMRNLIERPFKSEEETRIAWESLTEILGRYLYQNVKDSK